MKPLKLLLAALALVILLICVGSYWLYSLLTTPVKHDKAEQIVVIEKGSTPVQIISRLA